MSSVRAFLAVPLPDELKTSLAALQKNLAKRIFDVRWSRPENLHLTLRFFGETEQETLERVRVSMLSVKRGFSPFKLTVKGLGFFPNQARPRVVWLGLTPAERLRQLHALCEDSLRAVGIAPEGRPFVPHLTLGRLRSSGGSLTGIVSEFEQAVIGEVWVDQLVLYQSRLHPGGAEHKPLARVFLE